MATYAQLKQQQIDQEIKQLQARIKELRARKAAYATVDETPAEDQQPDQD